ncbi:MAG TPA: hypothetical protein VFS16_11400 [Acidimicrobiia bacterium]|nr:hypothetical protein [Acidimicrobiia bacterium]
MKRAFIVTLMCTALATGGALPAGAWPGPDMASSRVMAERYARLTAQGVGPATIQAVMAEEFGLRFLSQPVHPQDISFRPDAGMVILDTPTMGIGRDGNFHAFGALRWRHDCPFTGDEKIACWHHDKGKHGGEDGFAVRVSRPIVKKGGSLHLLDNCGKGTSWDAPAAGAADHGVGFIYQDKSYQSKASRPEYERSCAEGGSDAGYGFPDKAYNWDTAAIHMAFRWQEACRNADVAIKTAYGHTWNRTGLTGIGVSSNGISWSWENVEKQFVTEPKSDGSYSC